MVTVLGVSPADSVRRGHEVLEVSAGLGGDHFALQLGERGDCRTLRKNNDVVGAGAFANLTL
jgi:predicted methyltransferase